ncbi:MAG: hypothetical protein D6790_10255, partial [Caldilineae bacterium]
MQPSNPPHAGEVTADNGADRARAGAENPLSEREMDVARLLVTGASNAEIARELVISPHTVKVHLRNIYEKLEVNSRTEASMLLVSQGWVTVPGLETTSEPEPPDPEPLAETTGAPFAWQPVYLLASLLLSVALLLAPTLMQPVQSAPDLLSDGGVTVLGRPTMTDLPRWELRTPLPLPRSRLGLVSYQDAQLFAIGGETNQGQVLANVDAYDLQVNEWQPAAPLPAPLANMAVAATSDRILVAGGSTTTTERTGSPISDHLWAYRPDTDLWEDVGRLPAPLAGAAAVWMDDALYLLGGWDGEQLRDEVWRAQISDGGPVRAEDWEVVARLASPRAFAGAVAVDGDIYVAGGFDGVQELADARVFSPGDGAWRDLPPMAARRGGLSLLYDGLAVFAVGGGWTQPVDTIERFDPATELWSNFPAPIAGQWRHLGAAASPLGRLYLVGGWSGSYLDV